MGRKGYPAEFRRRALDLVAAGKTVAEVARLLEVSDQSIYTLAAAGADRPGRAAGAELGGARGAAGGAAADPGARDRAGGAPSRRRAAEGVGAPKRRFEAIAVIAGEGLPVEVACRVLERLVRRLLRLAVPAAVGACGPARVADRPDPRGARRLVRHLRRQAGARRARARSRDPGRPQRGRDADAASRDRRPQRRPQVARRARAAPTAEDLVDRQFRRDAARTSSG